MNNKRHPIQGRFWKKVDKTSSTKGCWLWTGTPSHKYGHINEGGQRGGMILVHRLSWEWAFGPVPDGLNVCHKCDTPKCVNPAHLFLGRDVDNLADMTRKGRRAHGTRHGNAKLTDAQVFEIRSLYGRGVKQVEIAERFGICQASVSVIVLRKARKLPTLHI